MPTDDELREEVRGQLSPCLDSAENDIQFVGEVERVSGGAWVPTRIWVDLPD